MEPLPHKPHSRTHTIATKSLFRWLSRSMCAPPALPTSDLPSASLLPPHNPQADAPCFLDHTHTLCQESEPFLAPSLTSLAWWRVSFLKTPPTCRVCRMVSLCFPCSLVHVCIHIHTSSQKDTHRWWERPQPSHCVLSFISVMHRFAGGLWASTMWCAVSYVPGVHQ